MEFFDFWAKYYQDGSFYMNRHFENAVNIGWGDKISENVYPLPQFELQIISQLEPYLNILFNETRGISPCPICGCNVEFNNQYLGVGEMRIIDADKKVYAVPDLIMHYIETHGYCPPNEFTNALNNGTNPISSEYQNYRANYEKKEYFWGSSDSYIKQADKLVLTLQENQFDKLSDSFKKIPSDINIIFYKGSLLSYAILNSSLEQVKFLVYSGINLNKLSGIELKQAIDNHEYEIAKYLIKAGITLNTSSIALNPLFRAIGANNKEIFLLLLNEKNMDPTIIQYNPYMGYCDALTYAKKLGKNEFVSYLESGKLQK